MSRSSRSVARRTITTPLILIAILAALLGLTLLVGSRPFNQTMIEIFIRIILVVGLYIFIGNSGVLSFGHIGFACIGAYMAAWLTMPPMMKKLSFPGLPDALLAVQMPYWAGAVLAAVFAAVVAGLFGWVLMRLSGISASIATFALLAMINTIWSNWDSVTAGTNSVVGIPIVRSIWPYFIGAVIAVLIGWLHAISRFGLALRAARDEPTAAAASGIDIPAQRWMAFVVSGFVVGGGGALFAHSLGVVTPDTFYLSLTFTTLSMLVVGGMGSLSGAVSGVVILSLLIQALRGLERGVEVGSLKFALPGGLQEITLGVVMILILMLRPGGLFTREFALSFGRGKTGSPAAEPAPTSRPA